MLTIAFFIALFSRRRFKIPAFNVGRYSPALAFRAGFAVKAFELRPKAHHCARNAVSLTNALGA